MKRKTILRREWRGIYARSYAEMPFNNSLGKGIAGLMYMDRAEDFCVRSSTGPLMITRDGYSWLQLAPENENVWATVMFDDNDRLFQCYFDITLENRLIEGGASEFTDLYLDVVIRPDTDEVSLYDENELEYALKTGRITPLQRQLAYDARKKLLVYIETEKQAFFQKCILLQKQLKPRLRPVAEVGE